MMSDRLSKFIKELIPYIVILVLVIFIRTYIVTPIKVNGASMQPTLYGDEVMLLTKYNKDKIEKFDIVVIHINLVYSGHRYDEDIIKRVIGMPGDKVYCEDGKIYVNSQLLDEEYSDGFTNDFSEVELKDDEYFVLGDNRDDSFDSSEFGVVKKEQIKGKTSLVLFPFSKLGNIEK